MYHREQIPLFIGDSEGVFFLAENIIKAKRLGLKITGVDVNYIENNTIAGMCYESLISTHPVTLDFIPVLFLVPLLFGLFVASKNNRYANSISILIIGILLTAPLLTGMTDKTNQPYRFMPMVIFFAVGVGILFSKVNSKV